MRKAGSSVEGRRLRAPPDAVFYLLGTIAARDEKLGYETLLVTGDKDAYQLASDLTRIVTTKKGITDVAIYGPAEVAPGLEEAAAAARAAAEQRGAESAGAGDEETDEGSEL